MIVLPVAGTCRDSSSSISQACATSGDSTSSATAGWRVVATASCVVSLKPRMRKPLRPKACSSAAGTCPSCDSTSMQRAPRSWAGRNSASSPAKRSVRSANSRA
jgi:hypothetical protein